MGNMKYNTIIFDLDGTLLNTLDDLCDSTNYALTINDLPQRTYEEMRTFVGNGILRMITLAVPNGTDNPKFEKVFEDFKAHYAKNCENKTKPYAGTEALVRDLSKKGFKLAIVSNKIDSAVKQLRDKYFSDVDVAIGETNGMAKKPAPDMVMHAMNILGASRVNTVYIGDSEVDIKTAQNSSLDCISVGWGFRTESELKASGADRVYFTCDEVYNALISIE